MKYCDFTVNKEGARAYSFTLPCFSDDERFYEAVRMNRFYSAVMDKLYSVGSFAVSGSERRIAYKCTYSIEECDGGERVDLTVTLRRTGEKTLRKYISHLWKGGYIVSESIK